MSDRVSNFLFLAVAALVSCDISQAGPCVHTYREPVLTIERVSDVSGRAVAALVLDSLALNGRPVDLRFAAVTTEPAFGVTSDGTTLTCTPPCGFGTEPGRYEFRLAAPGYTPTRVAINASYATFHGGCPSWNDDGTRSALSLQRP